MARDGGATGERARALSRCRRRLHRWARHAPVNFEPMHLLLEAERASLARGDPRGASLYDKASDSARRNGFRNIEALAAERADLKLVKVNTDEEQPLAAHYGVMGLPTVLILREGRPVGTITQAAPKRRLAAQIDAALAA
jgi:hypothetical protein